MAAREPAVGGKADPGQNVATEAFNQRQALAAVLASFGRPVVARRALGQIVQDLLDQGEGLLDLLDAHPHPSVDVAGLPHGDVEGEFAIGGVTWGLTRIEATGRGATDEPACPVLLRQDRAQDARRYRAILQ